MRARRIVSKWKHWPLCKACADGGQPLALRQRARPTQAAAKKAVVGVKRGSGTAAGAAKAQAHALSKALQQAAEQEDEERSDVSGKTCDEGEEEGQEEDEQGDEEEYGNWEDSEDEAQPPRVQARVRPARAGSSSSGDEVHLGASTSQPGASRQERAARRQREREHT